MEIALATVAEFSGPARASVLGRTQRLDMLHAALINGISSHVLDFDDTHLRTVIHPSGPVAPALLALAETRPVPGKDLLLAFVLGVEVECRIGNGVCPSHYDQGWHVTATAGVFGAAAAAGKLLHLSETQMVQALGIAATQAAGLREMFGTHCKPFHPGRAAQNGLFAALLAARGFTSSAEAIEGRRGFARVHGAGVRPGGDGQRAWRAVRDPLQHVQAFCLRHRHPPGHRRLHPAAQRSSASPPTRSSASTCGYTPWSWS